MDLLATMVEHVYHGQQHAHAHAAALRRRRKCARVNQRTRIPAPCMCIRWAATALVAPLHGYLLPAQRSPQQAVWGVPSKNCLSLDIGITCYSARAASPDIIFLRACGLLDYAIRPRASTQSGHHAGTNGTTMPDDTSFEDQQHAPQRFGLHLTERLQRPSRAHSSLKRLADSALHHPACVVQMRGSWRVHNARDQVPGPRDRCRHLSRQHREIGRPWGVSASTALAQQLACMHWCKASVLRWGIDRPRIPSNAALFQAQLPVRRMSAYQASDAS